jgi:transposase
VKADREAWGRDVLARAAELAPRLVFVDETGCNTKMGRTHGRAPPGERVPGRVPFGHWKTTTVIGAMRSDGVAAATTLDGATDADAFRAFVGEFLAPALRPGDVVVMDNLSAHHAAGVRGAVEAAGATLMHLPAYSPDLNPIEKLWSKLKKLLRDAAARTVDALLRAIEHALTQVNASDCLAWFRSCGYAAESAK